MATVTLGSKGVGSSVYLDENGAPVEFVVAHQGSPSSAYSGFDGGTVLVRKGAHSSRIWGEDNGERYYNYPNDCEIHTWLNSTYLNTLDADIRAAVKQVKIPYVSEVDFGDAGSVNQGSNGLSCKAFLLSLAEIEIPKACSGNILPVNRTDVPERDCVFIQISESQVGRAVRTKDWKRKCRC